MLFELTFKHVTLITTGATPLNDRLIVLVSCLFQLNNSCSINPSVIIVLYHRLTSDCMFITIIIRETFYFISKLFSTPELLLTWPSLARLYANWKMYFFPIFAHIWILHWLDTLLMAFTVVYWYICCVSSQTVRWLPYDYPNKSTKLQLLLRKEFFSSMELLEWRVALVCPWISLKRMRWLHHRLCLTMYCTILR